MGTDLPLARAPPTSARSAMASATDEPAWHAELANASQAIPGEFFTADTLRKRALLMRAVKADGSSPTKWLLILRCLNDERRRMARHLPAGSAKRGEMYRALFGLYHRAVDMIPVTSANRHMREYLDLWMEFAQLQSEDPEAYDDVRQLFKFCKVQRIGREEPSFYEVWIRFEESRGEHVKANKVRAEAVKAIPGFSMPSTRPRAAPAATVSSTTRPRAAPAAQTGTTPAASSTRLNSRQPTSTTPAASKEPTNLNSRLTPLPTATNQPSRPPAFRSDRKVLSSPASRQAETPATTHASRRYAHITTPQSVTANNLPQSNPAHDYKPLPATPQLTAVTDLPPPQYLSRSKTSQPAATPSAVLQDVPQPQTLTRAKTSPYRSTKDAQSPLPGYHATKENVAPARAESPYGHPKHSQAASASFRATKENVAPDRTASPEIIRSATRPAAIQRETYEAARKEERYNPTSSSRRDEADYRDYLSKYSPQEQPERNAYASKSPPLNDPIFSRREAERNSDRMRGRSRDEEADYARDVRGYDAGRRSRRSRSYNPFEDMMVPDKQVCVNGKPYLVLELVGKGGSSQVFKVLDQNMKMHALKRVQARGESLESFSNEIGLLRRLRGNPWIVELHDSEVQRDKGLIHVVMEYGEIDLSKLLQRKRGKPMTETQVMVYWENMLHSVRAIHEEKIVHSDLKPANFLNVSGDLKLIDFGIAKAIVSEDTTKIIRDAQVGTPNYMSPEALIAIGQDESDDSYDDYRPAPKGRFRISRASDIWSLGCILYQMAFKRPPFAHIRDQNMKLMRIQDPNYEIKFPKHDNPHLIQVLRGCLQRDPSKRLTMPQLLEHAYLRPVRAGAPAYGPGGMGQMAVEMLRGRGATLVVKHGVSAGEEMEWVITQLQVMCGGGDDTATHSFGAGRLPHRTPTSSRVTATAPSVP